MFVLKESNNLTLIDMLMIGEFPYFSMETDFFFLWMKIGHSLDKNLKKNNLDICLDSDPYTAVQLLWFRASQLVSLVSQIHL